MGGEGGGHFGKKGVHGGCKILENYGNEINLNFIDIIRCSVLIDLYHSLFKRPTNTLYI